MNIAGENAEPFDPSKPVLAQVAPKPWDQDRAVAYEVALEVIGDVIAAISGITSYEKRKPHPDTRLLAQLGAELSAAAAARNALGHDDWDQIRHVSTTYGARLRELDALLDERSELR